MTQTPVEADGDSLTWVSYDSRFTLTLLGHGLTYDSHGLINGGALTSYQVRYTDGSWVEVVTLEDPIDAAVAFADLGPSWQLRQTLFGTGVGEWNFVFGEGARTTFSDTQIIFTAESGEKLVCTGSGFFTGDQANSLVTSIQRFNSDGNLVNDHEITDAIPVGQLALAFQPSYGTSEFVFAELMAGDSEIQLAAPWITSVEGGAGNDVIRGANGGGVMVTYFDATGPVTRRSSQIRTAGHRRRRHRHPRERL